METTHKPSPLVIFPMILLSTKPSNSSSSRTRPSSSNSCRRSRRSSSWRPRRRREQPKKKRKKTFLLPKTLFPRTKKSKASSFYSKCPKCKTKWRLWKNKWRVCRRNSRNKVSSKLKLSKSSRRRFNKLCRLLFLKSSNSKSSRNWFRARKRFRKRFNMRYYPLLLRKCKIW